MKGIAAIRGEKLPRIDQEYFYEVASFYPGTVINNDQDIKWKLFTQEESGRWRELRGEVKRGRRVAYKFPQQWYGKKLLVEAFINNPEIKEPPGMIVMPVPGERSIKRISILDRNGKPFSKPPKYGQTIKVEIETVNMLGETLSVGLWERDTISSTGHSSTDNENIWGTDKAYKVTETSGVVTFSFVLDAAWAIKANKSLFEGSTHEYYLLVKGYGAGTKYSHQQNVTDEVVPTERNTTAQPGGAAPKQDRLPAQPAPAPQTPAGGQNPPVPATRPQAPAPQTQTPAPQAPATPATPAPTPQAQAPAPAPVQQQATIPASGVGADPAPVAGGKSTTTVEEEKVEGITDAYFARKEYTKQTGEAAATLEYVIKSNGNKTGTDAEKKRIAGIILNKDEVKALATKKEYTTEAAIIQALTKNVYNNGDKVTFQTFKLGPEFKRIPSAPLEDKVYLVATGYLLDGKQATITIKEKDGLLKGAPDAVLPVFEITEQQMDDPKAVITGTEKTTFTGTIQNGMVKIPVQLRPKDDEELKQWVAKTTKGKEDGTYIYTFNNEAGTPISAENKSRLAGIILANAKDGLKGNPKIETGKIAYAKDIEDVLQVKTYGKGEQITFKLYKKIPELLYLRVQAQGEKQHDKEFLKKEGAYFQIGNKCVCEERIKAYMRMLRVGEGTGELNKKGEKIDPQRGYSMAFGGNTITDLSKHPETNYGGSTAAGAYQVMRYTWWWLNGEKLDENNAKAGVYEEAHDYIKKYSIPDYQAESQDKVCIVIFKHKRSGILELITAGKIEAATRQIGSAEWASLPHVGDNSRYKFKGKLQPATPMKEVLEHYETFYKEELEGTSNLHIKKGFLKEFDIKCNCGGDAKVGDWHDPVDNPMSTNYYQNGNIDGTSKIWGLFGDDIRQEVSRKHTGLDLFATTGTDIYACVDGTVHNRRWHSGYGNTITIKVKDPKAFMARKREYTHKTTREMASGTNWSDTGDIYLFYAHLDSVNEFTLDQEVSAGAKLGKTGRSGVTGGTHAPHLHFEIFCSYNMGVGTNYRINPAYFVDYKYYDDQSEAERTAQETEKDRGKIDEVDGSDKLSATDLT